MFSRKNLDCMWRTRCQKYQGYACTNPYWAYYFWMRLPLRANQRIPGRVDSPHLCLAGRLTHKFSLAGVSRNRGCGVGHILYSLDRSKK